MLLPNNGHYWRFTRGAEPPVKWSQPGSNRRPPACKFGWDGGGWCRLGLVGAPERLRLLNDACWWRLLSPFASSLLRPSVHGGSARGRQIGSTYSMLRSAGRRRPATSAGVAPELKLIIQSANSGSDASTRSPLISRKVSIATRAVRLLPSMNG